jgi:hypothetical protein
VPERPKLLASLHDVSPLTLADSQAAVALLRDAGVPTAALTVLVVPFHEGRAVVADDPPTLAFLRGLAAEGATLVAHGYTHRMVGGPRTPWRWFMTRVFARNQGELAVCDAAEARARLDQADAIFARAGLLMTGFVPPAWLLSRGAADEVAARGFAFVERMGGLVGSGDAAVRARRLIGWGSLTWIEAVATSGFAWLQARRALADTRLAVHPPDLRRARTRRSLARTLARLVPRLEPMSYAAYFAGRASSAGTSTSAASTVVTSPMSDARPNPRIARLSLTISEP